MTVRRGTKLTGQNGEFTEMHNRPIIGLIPPPRASLQPCQIQPIPDIFDKPDLMWLTVASRYDILVAFA